MADTKQRESDKPKLDQDLEDNPGIGQSKGSFMTGILPEEIEGENTVEGDTDNNAGRFGQVKKDTGRSNR